MSKHKKIRFIIHYVKPTAQLLRIRFPKGGPTCRRQVVNPRHQTSQGQSVAKPETPLGHSDHVFLGLPHLLVLGFDKSVTDLIQDVVRCPYHPSRQLWRTAGISLTLIFWGNEAKGVSSRSLVDYGTVIATEPLQNRGMWSPRFATVEHSWVNAVAVKLLVHLMWKMHDNEDKQKSPELFQGHASSGSIGSKKWPLHQARCCRRPFKSLFCCWHIWGRCSFGQPLVT